MKKRSILFLVGIGIMLSFTACGEESGGHPAKTHEKDVTQNDFDVKKISWTLDTKDGLKISETNETLYLQYTHNLALPNLQFFIDVDNNPKTGVKLEGGADYMVENGWLYQADPQISWGWRDLKKPIKSVIDINKTDTVAIPRSLLKNRTEFIRVNAQVLDKKWMPQGASPRVKDGFYPKVKFPR